MRAAARWLAAALTFAAGAAAPAPAEPARSALQECAAIAQAAERLACYDRLAGRARAPAPAEPAPAKPASGAAAAARPAKESFGLYSAEHPVPPPTAQSLTGMVTAVGTSASGRPTVTLEGGQVWEFDTSDPLLAIGDMVTIRRASLGSFMLETPSKRRHRARRLN